MGVIFGDGVKTGINSSFNPGVKIGVNSRIGAGAIVSRDLDSHKVLIPLQDHHIIDNNR
jgi:bifunctional UDP-N-acetylglucosamine pyrophosphorylase/glucosamine-1-phosphate N-acetyltransferase